MFITGLTGLMNAAYTFCLAHECHLNVDCDTCVSYSPAS